MKILIREGSAARNFEALHELISEFPDRVMLCSDDKHPDELLLGHINLLVKRALQKGHDLFDVLQCACINPVRHYKLDVGLLQVGDPADFIVVDDLANFNVLYTYINGEKVVDNGKCILKPKKHARINRFSVNEKVADDFKITATGNQLKVIEAIDGQLISKPLIATTKIENGYAAADVENDVLKITVINRYRDEKPAVAFIKNFNLKSGAIASTVAHDSHNIIAVGVDDDSICRAVNLLIKNKGGLSVVDGNYEKVLPLPIAGLMSDLDCETVGNLYSELDQKVKSMGCELRAPYMTLSFMALLVIPSLKLSDKGLFDGEKFEFTELMM
jgi:adenine deaminase